MMTLVGAVFVAIASLLWGIDRAKKEKDRLAILLGAIAFVSYTEEQIRNFKTPLLGIFSGFTNDVLEMNGFCKTLVLEGAMPAVETLRDKLPKSAFCALESFAKELGGGYEKGQLSLCSITLKRLEKIAQEEEKSLPGKVRMYRLLPLLLSVSVIILLI